MLLAISFNEENFCFVYIQSNLEFNVRMQEFIELVRRADKMEAVRYVAYKKSYTVMLLIINY